MTRLNERQGWLLILALVVALERHLKRTGQPMLSHVSWRSLGFRAVVLAVAVHLLDHRRRLERYDLVHHVGRWL